MQIGSLCFKRLYVCLTIRKSEIKNKLCFAFGNNSAENNIPSYFTVHRKVCFSILIK